MTPVERALRQLAGVMVSCGQKHAEVEFTFGRLVATIEPAVADDPPMDATCPCGHLLEEHSGAGCLLGCSDSRCDDRAASLSQVEREVFEPIFAARSNTK